MYTCVQTSFIRREREEGRTTEETAEKRSDEGEDNFVETGNEIVKFTPRTQRHIAASQLIPDQTEPNDPLYHYSGRNEDKVTVDNTNSKDDNNIIIMTEMASNLKRGRRKWSVIYSFHTETNSK